MVHWVRGRFIGRGSFATVSLATAAAGGQSHTVAVKSASFPHSLTLLREKEVMTHLADCPQVLPCFGDDVTLEGGDSLYNLFVEYVPGGSLADLVKKSGGGLPERYVRSFARSILRGLCFIHAKGFVHCDVKLHNLLVHSSSEVRIADFGLAKRAGETVPELRGTPLYMSPELAARGECEAPADIWSYGCAVMEMITGRPLWRWSAEDGVASLLFRIGVLNERPELPAEMSEPEQDFLSKCLEREPAKRWTAEMLLNHPFLSEGEDAIDEDSNPVSPGEVFESPRSPFDFRQWNSLDSPVFPSLFECQDSIKKEGVDPFASSSAPGNRIQLLATGKDEAPNWFSDTGWIPVRGGDPCVCSSENDDHSAFTLEKMVTEDGKREEIATCQEMPATAPTTSPAEGDACRSTNSSPSQAPISEAGFAENLKHKRSGCNFEQSDCPSYCNCRTPGMTQGNSCINSYPKKYKSEHAVSH